MAQLSIMVDLDRCIGCKTCIVACRNANGLTDHEALPGQMPHYLRVESAREGSFPDLKFSTWVIPCQHCKNAQCIKACDAGAIAKDPVTGIVTINADQCDGSKACMEACPYDVIQFDELNGHAHKCDLCGDRISMGESPACVSACLTDALRFGEKELLVQEAQSLGKDIVRKMSAQSILYVRSPA